MSVRPCLAVLQWAREQGCKWDTWTCRRAAQAGHLHVLRWARENDCPWGADTMCKIAAQGGHLEAAAYTRPPFQLNLSRF